MFLDAAEARDDDRQKCDTESKCDKSNYAAFKNFKHHLFLFFPLSGSKPGVRSLAVEIVVVAVGELRHAPEGEKLAQIVAGDIGVPGHPSDLI